MDSTILSVKIVAKTEIVHSYSGLSSISLRILLIISFPSDLFKFRDEKKSVSRKVEQYSEVNLAKTSLLLEN